MREHSTTRKLAHHGQPQIFAPMVFSIFAAQFSKASPSESQPHLHHDTVNTAFAEQLREIAGMPTTDRYQKRCVRSVNSTCQVPKNTLTGNNRWLIWCAQVGGIGNVVAGIGTAVGVAAASKRQLILTYCNDSDRRFFSMLTDTFPTLGKLAQRKQPPPVTVFNDTSLASEPTLRRVIIWLRAQAANSVGLSLRKLFLSSRGNPIVARPAENGQAQPCVLRGMTRPHFFDDCAVQMLFSDTNLNKLPDANEVIQRVKRSGAFLFSIHVRTGDCYRRTSMPLLPSGHGPFSCGGRRQDARVPHNYNWTSFFACAKATSHLLLGNDVVYFVATDWTPLKQYARTAFGNELLELRSNGTIGHTGWDHSESTMLKSLTDFVMLSSADLSMVGHSSFGVNAARASGLPFLTYSFNSALDDICNLTLQRPI